MNRFWNKVEKTKSCWNWIASKFHDGYGSFRFGKRKVRAHRFVWFLVYHKWPKNQILHVCDNPACVRPSHLFEGTHIDNVNDRQQKERHAHILSKTQIKEIIFLRLIAHWPYKFLCSKFNVSRSTIRIHLK